MLFPSTRDLKIALALLLLFPPTAPAQTSGYQVVVTPGTPSIWSMEQAHYLLGRLRANNDGLRTKSPSTDDLDPNQTNALRLDAFQSRLGVAAALDSVVGAQNRAVQDRFRDDQERMPELMREADDLRKELEKGRTTLADLQGKKTTIEGLIAITTKPPTEIEALKSELAAVNGNIKTQEAKNTHMSSRIAELEKRSDLSGLKTVMPDTSTAKEFDRLLKVSTEALLKKTVDGFDRPKLHSTIALDNFLQMQYEILAKQLAMLRDEVGDGQRVIFLELPTSISAAGHKKWGVGGEDKLGQSWWAVKRIMRRYRVEDSPCFVGDAVYERFARSSKVDSAPRTTRIDGRNTPASEAERALESQIQDVRTKLEGLRTSEVRSQKDYESVPLIQGQTDRIYAEQQRKRDYSSQVVVLQEQESKLASDLERLRRTQRPMESLQRKSASLGIERDEKFREAITSKKGLSDPFEGMLEAHKRLEDLYDQLTGMTKEYTTAVKDPKGQLALVLGLANSIEVFRRQLLYHRERFIASIAPTEAKLYEASRAKVREMEAPCREVNAHAGVFEKAAFELDKKVDKELEKSKLENGERERLQDLKNLIEGLREVLSDRSDDLLAFHQARIYEYVGGPEMIGSAFYSDMEDVSALKAGRETGQLRAVELIPRQTALNVNTTHAKIQNSVLSGAWRALFGFGLKVDYQQQRENYDQFMQQEAFASGFGKGQAIFGWVFGPLPGARVLNSGVRNGYAVLAVPDDASALEIEGQGCAFHMKHRPPGNYREADTNPEFHCGQKLETLIGIPEVDNSGTFWIDAVNYTKVEPGQRTSVVIHGSYISPQTTVLVNGHRIPQVLGVGKPSQHMDAGSEAEPAPGDGLISGTFEFVNQQQMVVNLALPKGYSGGFPTITLVAPARAETINWMRLRVNGSPRRKLSGLSILPDPAAPKLTLSDVQLSGYNPKTNDVRLRLSGKLFEPGKTKVRLNGDPCTVPTADVISANLAYATCTDDPQPNWEVVVFNPNATDPTKTATAASAIPNPLMMTINSYEALAGKLKYGANNKPETYEVRLIGSGFTPRVRLNPNGKTKPTQVRVSFRSSTELYCLIRDPQGDISIDIEDSLTGKTAAITVSAPPDQATEKKPEGQTTVTTIQSERKITRK